MKRLLVALLLVAGCSSKPQQVEVIIKSDKPEMTAEEKAEEAKLKEINDLQGPAVDAYAKLSAEGRERRDKVRSEYGFALMAIDQEVEAIQRRDGEVAAAKFFHNELVGKSLDEVVAKWAPRYKSD